jgi:urease accessory protein
MVAAQQPAGEGRVTVERVGARSVVTAARAHSPLRLLEPRNHGDAAWIYVATFGGGLVDGDRIALDLEIGAGASAFLGTQASTKVYRSPRGCEQHLRARVGEGGLLVSIPDPVTCFTDARYQQHVEVDLQDGASALIVEGLTSGRTAYGERWAFTSYRARLRVGPIEDVVHLDPAHGPLARRMGRFDAIATIVAIGPRVAAIARALHDHVPAPAPRADLRIATSPITGGGALARIAGNNVETVTRAIRACCGGLTELLGDDPSRRP